MYKACVLIERGLFLCISIKAIDISISVVNGVSQRVNISSDFTSVLIA